MDLFIASNRQLPIRYYVNEAIWIRRGCLSFHQLTLPFFVEVEIKNPHHLLKITEYVQEVQKQYSYTEIQIIIKDKNNFMHLQKSLPDSNINHILTIEQLIRP
ncbi:hypothetical protein B1B04_07515 [Lysinibacillus sp. KCTC 33748]|uniref:hypothetical protein n=1 Tax=unclassified Lysinibacillus TaxID=2636778 RepID=UPI0009A79669|nr:MULTISPECIES: hypothetical protein [unclassified Lysinibacillus]OXS75556.1 hypothetical protein B1B04_07515 [Lysinibacillus sp. KCTC 33748]SKB55125.1 hypothetical protein SAMN06295926_103367 [Lysinibacillus sp. AC-3]